MAEKDKKFYWLKLKSEFMTGEVVDFLMSQKNGANYVVLYQMLAIKTMNTNGRLCSTIGEILIPFEPEKIQRECKWFDIDTIRVAMELYCKLGLLYRDDDNILQIANFEEMVGSETYWAKQKRLQRQADVGQLLDNVQNTLISNISNIDNNIDSSNSKEVKHKYGEYKHVLLLDKELEKLNADYGEQETQNAIKYLDEYIEMKGYKAKSHYLALRKWVFDAVNEKKAKNKPTQKEDMYEQLDRVFKEMQ